MQQAFWGERERHHLAVVDVNRKGNLVRKRRCWNFAWRGNSAASQLMVLACALYMSIELTVTEIGEVGLTQSACRKAAWRLNRDAR